LSFMISTPAGVMDTRYSSVLISLRIPAIISLPSLIPYAVFAALQMIIN
jgi:hypothetical protein